jgi:hypothetical protein
MDAYVGFEGWLAKFVFPFQRTLLKEIRLAMIAHN